MVESLPISFEKEEILIGDQVTLAADAAKYSEILGE